MAEETSKLITSTTLGLDHYWAMDHGIRTIVRHKYPDADIAILQLSIDYKQPAQYHYNLSKQIDSLRKKGVLIIVSGNKFHNSGMVQE